MDKQLSLITLALATLLLSSCATVDFEYPKPESYALATSNTEETRLGQYTDRLTADKPEDMAGFYMLPDAIEALAIRLLLADRAEQTLDAQYYLVKPDTAGLAFLHALLQAADRGVRVRLLIDDMFTGGKDNGLAALDHHPNLEVRVFNPFANRVARGWNGVTDLSRINRRMHNKSFTVDNQMTILGGRNIADEYFGAREDAHFGDLDVLSVGPIVDQVSASFDSYWNHRKAAAIPAFVDLPEDLDQALAQVRVSLETARQQTSSSVYADAVRQSAQALIDSPAEVYTWAPYELVVDSPDKVYKQQAAAASTMKLSLADSLKTATDEMILVSPYFVPLRSGITALSNVQKRGVDVKIITNSLSANNQFTVHGGYMPSRKPLLQSGVKIYEIRRDASFAGQDLVAASSAKSTLHTKAFVIDRRELFVGSFNFDPRSANINTEMGVIIQSAEMASLFTDQIYDSLKSVAWEVTLDDRNKLQWSGIDANGATMVRNKEPDTSWWDRFLANFVRALPIRGQL